MENLGHNSKAVHRAYAKHALVKIPALEDYEHARIRDVIAPQKVERGAQLYRLVDFGVWRFLLVPWQKAEKER